MNNVVTNTDNRPHTYATAYVADCETANQNTYHNDTLSSNVPHKQPTYVMGIPSRADPSITPTTVPPRNFSTATNAQALEIHGPYSHDKKGGSGSYQPPAYYKQDHEDDHGFFAPHEYKHGTGSYIPVRYKHTLSFACCCHYAIDCLAISLVIVFMACAGWVCYYALNNGGD